MLRLFFYNILFFIVILSKVTTTYSSYETTNSLELKPKIANNSPKIVTSIKPLQLIAIAITGTAKNVDVLLSPTDSPHNYQLKFSDTQKLQSTDIFIWVGKEMESFLPKIIAKISKKSTKVTMLDLPNIKKIPYKQQKKHIESNHTHHGCNHGTFDTHIWMDCHNSAVLARAITNDLIAIDKKNAAIYNHNLQYFLSQLDSFKSRSAKLLSKIATAEIFAFHDAYSYLEDQYKFNIVDYFTLDSTKEPGARHLYNIKNKLKQAKYPCLLIEPQFDATIFYRLIENTKVNISYIDPLAGDIALTEYGYILFLDSLVNSLTNCIIKK